MRLKTIHMSVVTKLQKNLKVTLDNAQGLNGQSDI